MDRARRVARNEHARAVLQDLWRHQYGESNAALARALKLSGPAVTEALSGGRGVGLDMLEAMADLTGRSIDDLIGRRPVAAARHALAANPRWMLARADAEKRLQHLRPEAMAKALDKVGGFGVPDEPVIMTGLFVAKLAEAIIAAPHEY